MSPIDELFQEIFEETPSKAGAAYEMLACIAEHLMNQGEVKHDDKIRGAFSESLYQIDILSDDGNDKAMGEAKDYTIQNKKVGRGDMQKLGGALPDLPDVTKGKFFSATGYTGPAKKYAAASENFSSGKPIEIFEFRPSTERDEEGTIQKIVIYMQFIIPRPQQGKWKPHLTEAGVAACKALVAEGETELEYNLKLEKFYDSSGNEKLSLNQLTSKNYGEVNSETKSAHGCFVLAEHYIYIKNVLVELNGLEYEVPFDEFHEKMEITDNSKCRFVVKDANGEICRFITDEHIRNYSFDEQGNLVAP
ncbi:restriction endonuclease [Idiomarina sp. HP20-50]|uniref:restriction endonuclease n=1 Tax=Idiomarina sp. HP20-50 TaxID=3070813 RepID=UPI00294B8CC4|nr:restriction endonuclease [Idiomarina sp. HP20-50]MDV6315922.1 restriction endonuclease [Idiomarina sp. HP20-50]